MVLKLTICSRCNSNIKLKSVKKQKIQTISLDILISENSNPDNVEIDFYRNNILVDRYNFEIKKEKKIQKILRFCNI